MIYFNCAGGGPIEKNVGANCTRGRHPLEKTEVWIIRTIKVTDEDGNILEPTYQKRAKGLIKHGRARAVGDDAIVLLDKPSDTIADETGLLQGCKTPDMRVRPLDERKEHMSNNYLEQVINSLVETLREPIDFHYDGEQVNLLCHHRHGMLRDVLAAIKEYEADKRAAEEKAFIKAEMANWKQQATDPANDEDGRKFAEDMYKKLLKKYMSDSQPQGTDGNKNVSMDTSNGYDFSDMPGMPRFIRQIINKGHFNPSMFPFVGQWANAVNNDVDDDDICDECGQEIDDCECDE